MRKFSLRIKNSLWFFSKQHFKISSAFSLRNMSPDAETCKNYFARDLFPVEIIDAHKQLSEKKACTDVDSIYEYIIKLVT